MFGEKPFRHWVFDDYFPVPSKCLDREWPWWEVHYYNELEHNKRTSREYTKMPISIHAAFVLLQAKETVNSFASITGIESLCNDSFSHGAGLHYSENGSYLQAHCDYEIHPFTEGKERRLNAILFLHPFWKKEWGGELLLCDMSGKTQVSIEPKPGRLAMFECGPTSMHGVRVIRNAEGPRVSAAVYYLADKRESATRTRAMFLPNRNKGGVPSEVS